MFGGWGDDVMVWNNGDGSDVMEGGHDYDTAVVNGSDTAGDEFAIAPNGDRVDFDRDQPRASSRSTSAPPRSSWSTAWAAMTSSPAPRASTG